MKLLLSRKDVHGKVFRGWPTVAKIATLRCTNVTLKNPDPRFKKSWVCSQIVFKAMFYF